MSTIDGQPETSEGQEEPDYADDSMFYSAADQLMEIIAEGGMIEETPEEPNQPSPLPPPPPPMECKNPHGRRKASPKQNTGPPKKDEFF